MTNSPSPKDTDVDKTTDNLPIIVLDRSFPDVESHPAVRSSDFRDGDAKSWMTVLGAFIALFCTFGHLSSFGTYQDWYENHQFRHLPPSTIAWIGSLQLFVFFLSGAPIGRLFDAYGQLSLMMSGATMLITSIVATSLATQLYQFILLQGILFALGVGMLFYPSLACISTRFERYRATALGLAASGSSVGGVVYPIMLRHLFNIVGFGWALRISALITVICCLVVLATVTSRTCPRATSNPWFDMATFRDARFTLLAVGCFFVASGGLFIPFIYITDYARDRAILPNGRIYILALMNLGGIPGRIIPARISDTIGHFSLLAPAAFFCGLACLVLWLPAKGSLLLLVFAVLYGFFSGAFVAIVTPCVVRISDVRAVGTRIGMLYSIISFPSLLGGPAAGVLLVKMNGSYTGTIAFSGITVIIGSVFIFLAKLQVDPRVFAPV